MPATAALKDLLSILNGFLCLHDISSPQLSLCWSRRRWASPGCLSDFLPIGPGFFFGCDLNVTCGLMFALLLGLIWFTPGINILIVRNKPLKCVRWWSICVLLVMISLNLGGKSDGSLEEWDHLEDNYVQCLHITSVFFLSSSKTTF